jgi:hypothetical protein
MDNHTPRFHSDRRQIEAANRSRLERGDTHSVRGKVSFVSACFRMPSPERRLELAHGLVWCHDDNPKKPWLPLLTSTTRLLTLLQYKSWWETYTNEFPGQGADAPTANPIHPWDNSRHRTRALQCDGSKRVGSCRNYSDTTITLTIQRRLVLTRRPSRPL